MEPVQAVSPATPPGNCTGVRMLRGCGACLLLLLCASDFSGAEPRTAVFDPRWAGPANDQDNQLSLQIRQALYNDVQLSTYNLGVEVRDHVAIVWGPVPSQELARRAVSCVRRVQGVADVVDRLTVESSSDPLNDFLKLPPRPLPFAPPVPGLRKLQPSGALTGQADGARPQPPEWHPSRSGPAAPPVAPVPETPAAPPAVLTLPAIPLPRAPAASVALPHAVERLQQGYPRLRGLRPEVRGGVVYLRGTIKSWEDLQALARAISLVPGVERVILDNVKEDRKPY